MANQNRQNDEMDRQLGGSGREDEGYGQQAPARGPGDQDDDRQTEMRDDERVGEDE